MWPNELKIASEITSVRGELCEKASKTWSGNCGNTGHCDNQCKSREGATDLFTILNQN